MGGRQIFTPGSEYKCAVCGLETGTLSQFPSTADYTYYTVRCSDSGCIKVKHTFKREQQYFIRFFGDDDKRIAQFCVYAVNSDLAGRIPFIGDLHMHTNKSDGHETPEVVCANYRKYGYDFMVISDHRRYYPSLDAIKAYADVPVSLNIVCGEEVHLPRIEGKENVHIVNFGGEYSVNALCDGPQWEEVGNGKEYRSLNGECPDTMTNEEYEAKIREIASELHAPDYIDAIPAAMCKFAFDEIRKANGLAIFPHPTWISDMYHSSEPFTAYLTENKMFDAFEVLGGENYYEHNGFQTQKYYEDRAKGLKYPIVGSTDSHSSYDSNRNAFICATMVFAPKNDRVELINSIKDYYSVAIDTISAEWRLVGEARLVRYACFLLKNYFPIHDEIAFEEGRLMKEYVTGTDEEKADAAKALDFISDRQAKLQKKYFDFDILQ
ncbi:MAG: hypothetical protein K6B52_07540 [Clostridiales bacterium]|nr:hypothetical protein [Clostridiales bacterium]